MIEHDPFSPEYFSCITKQLLKNSKTESISTNTLYKNCNTEKYKRIIICDLLPASKYSVTFENDFDSNQDDLTFSFDLIMSLRDKLVSILSRFNSIYILQDIKLSFNKSKNIWKSEPSLLFYSRKCQDRHMYFTFNSGLYTQFFIQHPNKSISFIGNIDGFENDTSFSAFINEIMHNIGVKEQIKYQF